MHYYFVKSKHIDFEIRELVSNGEFSTDETVTTVNITSTFRFQNLDDIEIGTGTENR